jgi:signal transduction histidine kinase
MSSFDAGLLVGVAASAVLAVVAGAYFYRRFVLLERRTRQAERLAEIGRLTGGLAHEIKNPLSTIGLNLQLLQEDLDPSASNYPRLASRLVTVRSEASRLRAILDDFLRFAGRIELERKAADLNVLLDELVDFYAPQAQLQHVQLRLRHAAGPVVAEVDVRLLKQAVLNLMINALQAMPGGGDLIVSLSAAGGEAVIDVIDTGPGIAPDVLGRIFHAYYTTKRGGTGLGLAMTRRIAEEHGGRLTVDSELGKGSQFRIHVPLKRHESVAGRRASASAGAPAPVPPTATRVAADAPATPPPGTAFAAGD